MLDLLVLLLAGETFQLSDVRLLMNVCVDFCRSMMVHECELLSFFMRGSFCVYGVQRIFVEASTEAFFLVYVRPV